MLPKGAVRSRCPGRLRFRVGLESSTCTGIARRRLVPRQAPADVVAAGHADPERQLAGEESCKLPPTALDAMNAGRQHRNVEFARKRH